jgi:hypothetical protein
MINLISILKKLCFCRCCRDDETESSIEIHISNNCYCEKRRYYISTQDLDKLIQHLSEMEKNKNID